MALPYWVGYYLCRCVLRAFFDVEVTGVENIPKSKGLLIASNHSSAIDPVVIGATVTRPLYYMAKEELFRYPLISHLLRSFNAFPVRRGQADRKAIRKALDVLQNGHALLMFPEGTRNPNTQLRRPQLGVALLAMKAGVPIIPVAVIGTDSVMPPETLAIRRAPIRVRFGELLTFARDGDGEDERSKLRSIADEVMHSIARLSGRPYVSEVQDVADVPSPPDGRGLG